MSTGQIVGGITGAAVGFAIGGPTGALYGAQIGITAGGLLDPPKGPTVEGPRLGDLSVQTSTYGQFIPRTYGTIGLSGNVFWLENNQIKEVAKKKKSGGKGGGSSTTVKTYTYFATFAVGLCEGPIAGIRRLWVGPDLIYDAGSDDLETIIASNQASSKFTIYLGTDTQQPDPRMQAEMGVANCPAYRGLAYVVMKDLPLADYGNSVAGAQVKVEVAANIAGAQNVLFDVASPVPGVQAYAPGRPRDYLSGFYFSGYALGKTTAYKLSSGGNTSEISIPGGVNLSDWKVLDNSIQSLDSNDLVFVKNDAFGTENILLISGNNLRQVTTGFRLSGFRYSERNGHKWARFTADDNNAGVSPTGAWTAKISEDNDALINWTYSSRFSVGAIDDKFTPSPDGLIVSHTHSSGPGVPGTMTINAYDAFGALSYTFSFTLNATAAAKIHYQSAAFIDENMIGHFVFKLYAIPDSPSEYGKVYYVKVDLQKRVLISQGEIFFSGLTVAGHVNTDICYEQDGVIYVGSVNDSSDNLYFAFSHSSITQSSVTLSSIIIDEVSRSSLIKPIDLDTSGIVDYVNGFKVSATGSIRNAIEPLRGAWPFDVVQSGYQIKASSRGSSSVVTIPVGDLAIDTQLAESREMDSQLPQNVTVKYIDRNRDYDVNEQRAQRDNTEAVNSLVVDLPVVLSAAQSAQVAEKLIRIYALEKSDFSFTLPAPYRYLEAGDVITIATDDADFVLRLVSVNYTADGRLECSGRPSSAATYTSIAPGDGGQTGGVTIPLAGSTIGIIIDCPVIDESLQNSPGFASAFTGETAGWPGGVLYQTADSGQTWTDLQAFDGKSTAGKAYNSLAANAGNLVQKGGSLTVSLISGELESVTEAQMLNGANIAAYGVNGRWEIIRFQNSTLNGDGTYTLDTFWRGDRGTEWATGLHAANDYFVLMTDPDLAFVGMPTDSIGQPRDYRAVTIGADINSATSSAFTYTGVNLETYSGAHPVGSRSSNDLTINWQRRTRVGGAWRDNVDASLGETTEAYEVDIMQGSVVKRTLTATTPSVLYTSAMQITDFGSNQSAVTVKIYQLSSVVGRGYPLEATL
jgi:hypothetical protein